MQNRILKENRRHGSAFLPINNYKIDTPNTRMVLNCHWHEEFELFHVVKGKFRFQIASQYYDVCDGDILFVNSGELHSANAEKKGDFIFRAVVFSPEMLEGAANDKIQLEYLAPLISGNRTVQRLFQQKSDIDLNLQNYFDQIYALLEEKPPAYEITLKAYLFLILGELVKSGTEITQGQGRVKNAAAAENIKEVIRFLQENYQQPLTAGALAGHCHLSTGHFCRMFKKYTMKTPIEYVNCFRLSKAAELLESTDRKILDIALDCGFNSLSYFVNVFHQSIGCTPSEFRKNKPAPNESTLK